MASTASDMATYSVPAGLNSVALSDTGNQAAKRSAG